MTNKITLSIEEKVLGYARGHADETGRSLSELVSNYLREPLKTHISLLTSPLIPLQKRGKG